METLAERLQHLMVEREMTQAQLAERAAISQNAVHKLATGKARSSRYLVQIAETLGTTAEWLSTGQGEMSIRPGHRSSAKAGHSNTQEDGTVMIEITHQGERPADDIELLRKMVSLWAGGAGAAAPAVVIRRGGELIPPITQVRRRGGKPADPVHEVASRGGNLTERDDKNL